MTRDYSEYERDLDRNTARLEDIESHRNYWRSYYIAPTEVSTNDRDTPGNPQTKKESTDGHQQD